LTVAKVERFWVFTTYGLRGQRLETHHSRQIGNGAFNLPLRYDWGIRDGFHTLQLRCLCWRAAVIL